jgi:hypothetical protein
MDDDYFNQQKQKAKELYHSQNTIFNPYFNQDVALNAKGFHHLQNSGGRLRSLKEQLFKFRFLELAFEVIKSSSTIQEYREEDIKEAGIIKRVQYWGMMAIVGEKRFQIKAVIRKVGDGEIHFWSVMPYSRIKKDKQKIYEEGIESD